MCSTTRCYYCITKNEDMMVSDIIAISPRLMAVDICVKGYKLRIISAYAPTEGPPISTKEVFYRDLENLYQMEKKASTDPSRSKCTINHYVNTTIL